VIAPFAWDAAVRGARDPVVTDVRGADACVHDAGVTRRAWVTVVAGPVEADVDAYAAVVARVGGARDAVIAVEW
jgi:hypothetical protein